MALCFLRETAFSVPLVVTATPCGALLMKSSGGVVRDPGGNSDGFSTQAKDFAEDRQQAELFRAEERLVERKFDGLDREGDGFIDSEMVTRDSRGRKGG